MESPCINVCVIDASTAAVRGLQPVARGDRRLGGDDGRGAPAYHARAAARRQAWRSQAGGEVSMGAWIALTLLVIAGLALLLRADAGSIAGFDPSDFAIAVAGVALLIFLGSSIAGSYRGRAGPGRARSAHLVAGGAAAGRRLQLPRRDPQPRPPGGRRAAAARQRAARSDAQVDGERSVRIRRRPDGHFVAKTQVNGVSLTHAGRHRRLDRGAEAGRCPEAGHRRRPAAAITVPVQTANGTTYAAHVRLRNLTLGPDQPQRRRGAGGQARSAQGEPARYEFLKPPALL